MNRLVRHWPLAASLASAAALATAHGFETFGRLAPCELCLKAREVYWLALAVSGAGLALSLARPQADRAVDLVLALVFFGGTVLAVYHAGAEWKVWPGPASCSGGATRVSGADLARMLAGGGGAPSCETAAFVFLGLSMAGWNALASLALTIGSVWAAMRRQR